MRLVRQLSPEIRSRSKALASPVDNIKRVGHEGNVIAILFNDGLQEGSYILFRFEVISRIVATKLFVCHNKITIKRPCS